MIAASERSETEATPVTFDAVFTKYHRWVAGIAARLTGRTADVEDVVQDVFLVCARKIDAIESLDAAKPWLRTVTVRVVRKRLRRKKWQAWFLSDDTALGELPYRGLSPEERAMLEALQRALEALPVNQRVAWTLRHVEGASLDDVARSCECSLATAKRWIAAAATHLKDEGHGRTP